MLRRNVLIAFLAFAVTAPAAAQTTSFTRTLTRSYFGCLPGVSCHKAIIRWVFDDSGPLPGYSGLANLESFFGHNPWGAGSVSAMYACPFLFPLWDEMCESPSMSSPAARSYFNQTYPVFGYGTLKWVGVQVFYGIPPGTWAPGPYASFVELTPTPEPASVILFGTGLGAVWLARRKRKARTRS